MPVVVVIVLKLSIVPLANPFVKVTVDPDAVNVTLTPPEIPVPVTSIPVLKVALLATVTVLEPNVVLQL